MDIETMKTFLVLVDTKNFTRTAHQLFIAQSTVTNRILELEKELNVTLFERNNRSVELTPAGERFSLYAASVIRLTDTAMAEIVPFISLKIRCVSVRRTLFMKHIWRRSFRRIKEITRKMP